MSKYKTISNSYRQSLEQSIEKKIHYNSINRKTVDYSTESPLMSTNKSIIYIQLPKQQQNSNQFKSSLYEPSLKRLKQLQPSPKQMKIPNIANRRKRYEQFEEQTLRQYNMEKQQTKVLPSVNTSFNRMQQQKSNYTLLLEEQQLDEVEENDLDIRQLTSNVDKKCFFDVDQSVFAHKNLKEKYLQSKESSFNHKQKKEFFGKNHSRSSLLDYEENEVSKYSPHKFKMNKEIEEHMNRYNQKDLFYARLKGFKTNIYPISNSIKAKPSFKNSQPEKSEFSNFVKRKKLKSMAMYNQSKSSNKHKKLKMLQSSLENSCKIVDCSPWETDLNNFD